ncbi:hypothetical protein [Chondromyces apiculatus]|uniref:Uncharacterized protein n=1 Tax=Chondromyces apiculatus DSM 436 TaxID=1192034 RepID=A0A017TAV6_9BACT|nr:hypothetical protein [Chondromyces apiculatus]EYF06418.1 Hypothetical protein CAP_1948 [Chondromyces apiculatus DSM 436]
MLKPPFDSLTPDELTLMESGLSDRLADAIRAVPARAWSTNLPAEYDRGPADQAPRLAVVQSLLDRV